MMGMMTGSCCPICYRATTDERVTGTGSSRIEFGGVVKKGEGEVTEQRFFRLLERYLGVRAEDDGVGWLGGKSGKKKTNTPPSKTADNPKDIGRVPLDKLIGRGRGLLAGCGECLELMEGFCEKYHQLKTIELELNWKVERLRNVMKGAGRNPSRVSYLREVMGRVGIAEGKGPPKDAKDLTDSLIRGKKGLIEKCSLRLRGTFPKLPLVKWQQTNPIDGGRGWIASAGGIYGANSPPGTLTPTWSKAIYVPCLPVSTAVLEKNHPWNASHPEPELEDHSLAAPPAPPQFYLAEMDDEGSDDESHCCDDTMMTPTDHLQHDERQDSDTASRENRRNASNRKRQLTGGLDSGTDDVPVPKSKQIHVDNDDVGSHYSTAMDNDVNDDVEIELSHDDNGKLPNPAEDDSEPVVDPASVQLSSINKLELKTEPQLNNPPELERAMGSPPPSSMSVIALPEPSPEAKVSRLRSSHRCSHCGRTFSSDERLQQHVQEDHKDDDRTRDSLEDDMSSDNENEDVGNDGGDSEYAGCVDENAESDGDDGESMSWTSSSSESEYEIKLESKSPHKSLEEVDPLEGSPAASTQPKKKTRRRDSKTSSGTRRNSSKSEGQDNCPETLDNILKFKCPDCSHLFESMKDLLIHRKDSSSCKRLYRSSPNIRVEVLLMPAGSPGGNDSDPLKSTSIPNSPFAIIDIPQQIFICEEKDCGQAVFYTQHGLEDHRKLHGSFQCKFCKVKKSYAPDLSLHEQGKHAPYKKNTRKGDRHKVYNCPRCDFEVRGSEGSQTFIRHHLKHHFKLLFSEPVCAICQHQVSLVRRYLKAHLKTHHDLTNVAPEDIKRCPNDNCKSYFLTSTQLKAHQSKCYRSANQTGTGIRLKCPDCSHLFESINAFIVHRKDSMSCGEPYDPAATVRVEVLVPSPTSLKDDNDGGGVTNNKNTKSKFSHRVAIIDLPQGIFPCDICQTYVYSSEDMEAHKKLHGSFPCGRSSCNEVLTFAPKLALHELKHKRRRDKKKRSKLSGMGISCPRCDFKCSASGSMRTYVHHYLKQHLSLTWNKPDCPICNTNPDYTHAVQLGDHFKRFHDLTNAPTSPENVKRCTATNCQAYFLTAFQLQSHLRMKHNLDAKTKKYKCQDCGQSFVAPHNLRAHRLKSHAAKIATIPCVFENCPRVFESKEEIHKHITGPRTVHNPLDDPSKKVPCPKCEASFSGAEPNLLVQHLKSQHARDKLSYFCELCGKSFKDKCRLAVHSLTHSGPDSWEFSCSFCSRKCMTKFKLEEHERTHTNEKRFVCDVCGDKFAQPVHLKAHAQRKHAGTGNGGNQLQEEEGPTAPKKKFTGKIKDKLAQPPPRKKKCTKKKEISDEDEFGEEWDHVYGDSD